MEGVGGGVVVDLGAEDRVGILEIVEGIFESSDFGWLREEEAEHGDARADGNGLAPAKLCSARGAGFDGLGRFWALGLIIAVLGHLDGSTK